MPKIIPSEVKDRLIILLLLGHTRDEVAEKHSVGQGTVSNTWDGFCEEVGKAECEAVRTLGRFCREKGVTIQDSINGIRINSILQRFEIKDDALHSFLSSIVIPYQQSGLEPAELIKFAKVLFELQNETKIPIKKQPEHYRNLLTKSQELENAVKSLEEKKKQAKQNLESVLEEKDVTLKNLNDYLSTKNHLEELGLSLDDLSNLETMLRTASSEDWNPELILEKITKLEDYDKRVTDASKDLNKLNNEIDLKNKQQDKLDKDISSKKTTIAKLASTIRTLENDEQRLKSSISTTKDFSIKQIKEVAENSKNVIFSIQTASEKNIENSIKTHDETMNNLSKKQRRDLNDFVTTFAEILDETLKTSTEVGKLKALLPISKILELKGEPYEVHPTMLTLLEKYWLWYLRQDDKQAYISRKLEDLISILKKEIANAATA